MTALMLNETAAAIVPANDLPPVLFDDFISFVDRTEKTARTYITNLKQFAAWLAYSAISRPARQDVLSYRNYLLSEHDAIQLAPDQPRGRGTKGPALTRSDDRGAGG